MTQNTLLKNMSQVTLFALPISANGLINMAASFIAMLFVAERGQVELAAGAIAVPTYITINAVIGTIFYALGILISHTKTHENMLEETGHLVRNGLWMAVLLAVPSFFILFHIDKLLLLFKQDPALVQITRPYFYYSAFLAFPALITTVVAQFYTGIGNPRFVMMLSLISLPVTVALSYGLVLGKFHLPALGLAGIACSSLIVQSFFSIYLLLYLFFGKDVRKYHILANDWFPDWKVCKSIFSLGMPIGIQFGAELVAMTVSTYLMGYFGVIALASSQIVSQYVVLVIMIILGLSQALSLLISEAYSKQDFALIKQYIHSTVLVFLILLAFVCVLFYFFPRVLLGFYVDIHDPLNHELVHLTIIFFAISGVFLLVDGVRNLLSGALRGLHDTKGSMKLGIICLWMISLPASYLVGFTLNGGPVGLRIGFMTGFIVAVILLWRQLHKSTNIKVGK